MILEKMLKYIIISNNYYKQHNGRNFDKKLKDKIKLSPIDQIYSPPNFKVAKYFRRS